MDPKACNAPKSGAGCFIVAVGIISIVSNCIAFARLHISPIDRTKGLYLRILCVSSVLLAMLTILSTSLTISACFLGNDTTCVLLGAIFRLMRTAEHLLLMIIFINALYTRVQLHPQKHALKTTLHALTVIWVAIVVFLEVLMCPTTACKYRPGLIVCDVSLDHIFIIVDSLIFCVPIATVLALCTGILVVESNRQNEASPRRKLSLNQDSHLTPIKRMAIAGVYISVLKTMEWGTRIAAVVGSKHLHSPSLLTQSVLIMLVGIFSIPSSLVLSLQASEEEPSIEDPIERIRRAMAEAQEQHRELDPSISRSSSIVFRRPKSRSNHFVSRPLRASIFDSIEITRYNFGGLHLPLSQNVRTRSFDNTNDPQRLDLETLGLLHDDSAVSKSSEALVPIKHDNMTRQSGASNMLSSMDELTCRGKNDSAAEFDHLHHRSKSQTTYTGSKQFEIPAIAITLVDDDNLEVQLETF